MLPYLMVIALLVACVLVEDATRSYRRLDGRFGVALNGMLSASAAGVLFVFSAIRFGVGTDYQFYLQRYERMSPIYGLDQTGDSYQEPGYVALSLVLKSISDSPFAIFFLMAFVSVGATYAAIRRTSSSPSLSLFLYVTLAYYLSAFNTMRQGASVALLLLAATFLPRQRAIFLLLSVSASLLHVSAAIAATTIFLVQYWRPTFKGVAVLAIGAVITAVGFQQASFLGPLISLINPRYETYLESRGAGVGTYLVLLVVALLVALGYLLRDSGDDYLLALATIGVLLLAVGTQSIPLTRMESYFTVFLILLLPNQLAREREKIRAPVKGNSLVLGRMSAGGVTAALVVVCFIYSIFYVRSYGGLLPYRTVLSR